MKIINNTTEKLADDLRVTIKNAAGSLWPLPVFLSMHLKN